MSTMPPGVAAASTRSTTNDAVRVPFIRAAGTDVDGPSGQRSHQTPEEPDGQAELLQTLPVL